MASLISLLISACGPTVIVVTATPTATTVASPTPFPTATAVRSPTPQPSATPPPSSTAAIVLPPTPVGGGYASQSACDQPYLPLRLGATWTYRITSDRDQTYEAREIRTVSSVTGDAVSATATLRIEQTRAGRVLYKADVVYDCSPEGYTLDGGALVPWANFEPGAAWQDVRKWTRQTGDSCWEAGEYSQTYAFAVSAAPAIESVAGTHDGILMTQIGSLSVGPRTSSKECAENTGSRTWLVPGIGRVRSEHTLTNLDNSYRSTTVYDLESFSIP
ncbi:MAG: hypothetical protein FJ030_18630 [Chloroflexi bacterium]|nr:hypothetical protein [Chloroflexota bacterium]